MEPRPAAEQRPGEPRFRPDLEGFRGIAILLVLLCHARLPGAEAGFIGVDVFFVLSGFLITGLLVDESQRTGRIRLGAFYGRRARRILPAAVVVLGSTLLAAQLVLSPLDLPRVADDAFAASLSVANVRFALDATDYFAPDARVAGAALWSLGSRSSSTCSGRSCCCSRPGLAAPARDDAPHCSFFWWARSSCRS